MVLFNADVDALGENKSKQTPRLNFNSYFIRITFLLLDKVSLEQKQRYILIAAKLYVHLYCTTVLIQYKLIMLAYVERR